MADGLHLEVRGTVQGVGFRPFVCRLAREGGLAGDVRNASGGVRIDVYGPGEALDAFVRKLTEAAPPGAEVTGIARRAIRQQRPPATFSVVPSAADGARTLSIPPDLATCGACLRELFDPQDRRHRYPLINCTHCGPRWSLVSGVPYDRAATTMADFPMCDACRREYEDPRNRRFHAEPIACWDCGPRYVLKDPRGRTLHAGDPVRTAAALLRGGAVVAVKGIGGFHLACDAGDEEAVETLRRMKRRFHKPFAVMVADAEAAAQLCHVSQAERSLLEDPARPVVLLPRRAGAPVAAAVAPDTPLLGLLLPYAPVHHLLLAETRALVMTSGNLADEPLAYRDDEATQRLGHLADVFLVHDRAIAGPADDSVARVVGGAPVLLRRSRGFVPSPLRTRFVFPRPVLACGGQLKDTFVVGVGDALYAGPHVGDLDGVAAAAFFEEGVERLLRLLDVTPSVIAHDLHPGYASTAWACRQPQPRVAVQHHHAHLASAIAEHGLDGPVVGLVYDGTGYGTDGTAWGGELLRGTRSGFQRLATFRPLGLPGGDAAIREVWRIALALLEDAYDGHPPLDELELFRMVGRSELESVRRIVRVPSLTPAARGVGRLFDALGALGLARPCSRYEGEVAAAWELAAGPPEHGAYPFLVDHHASLPELDTRLLVRAAVEDLRRGVPAGRVSSRFHDALVRASAALVGELTRPGEPVVLTGGCFANARLTEGLVQALAPRRVVLRHRRVPPGDGGLAFGQALVAGASLG